MSRYDEVRGELKTKLVAAHNAGDTKKAQSYADQMNDMSDNKEQWESTASDDAGLIAQDVAKIAPRVVKNTVDFPQEGAGLISQGLEWARGKLPVTGPMGQSTMGMTARALLERSLGAAGDMPKPSDLVSEDILESATGRSVPEGKYPALDTALFGGELLGATPRTLLMKGAPLAARLRNIAPDVGGSLGGMAGQATGRELDERFDTEWGETTGSILGALLGGPAAIKATTPKADEVAQRVGALINANTADSPAPYATRRPAPTAESWLEGGTAEATPLAQLAERFSSPQALEEGGTAAQVLGGDRTLQGLVKYAQPESPRANDAILRAEAQRIEKTVGATEKLLGGADDVAPAVEQTGGLVQALQQKIINTRRAGEQRAAVAVTPVEAQTGLAQARAQQAAQQAEVEEGFSAANRAQLTEAAPTPGEASRQVHSTATLSRDVAKETAADPLWKIVDEHPDIPTEELKSRLLGKIQEMHPSLDYPSGEAFLEKYSDFLARIDRLPDSLPASEIQFLRSKLSTTLHNASTMGQKQMLAGEGQRMINEVDDYINDLIPEHAQAISATKQLHKTYDPLKLEGTSPETMLTPSSITGGKGAETARNLRKPNDPDIDRKVEEYVLGQFNTKTGSAQKFLDDRADFLKSYPGIRNKIEAQAKTEAASDTAAVASTEAATAATEAQAGLTKARAGQAAAKTKGQRQSKKRLTQLSKTMARQYERNPSKAINNAFRDPQGGKRLGDLYERLKATGQGEAFKGQVRKEVMAVLHPKFAGKRTALPSSIDKFGEVRSTLVEMGAINKDEAAKIAKVLDRTKSDLVGNEAIKAAGENVSNEAAKLKASAGATLVPLPTGHNLMMRGAIRRALMNHVGIKANPDPQVVDMLAKALTEPDTLKKLAKMVDQKQIDDLVSSRLATLVAGTADTDNERGWEKQK